MTGPQAGRQYNEVREVFLDSLRVLSAFVAGHLVLFPSEHNFNDPHSGLSLPPGFVNCIGGQCYRHCIRDRGLIDDGAFLCRAITHDIKFCGPSTGRKKRE